MGQAAHKVYDLSIFSIKMLGRMVVGDVSWKNLSGPITIADYAGQSAQMGWVSFLLFLTTSLLPGDPALQILVQLTDGRVRDLELLRLVEQYDVGGRRLVDTSRQIRHSTHSLAGRCCCSRCPWPRCSG